MSVSAQLWLTAALLAAPPSEQVEQIQQIFANDHYLFCADDTRYEPSSDDLRWCELAAASQFRGCPGYAKVCTAELPWGVGQAVEGATPELPESEDESEPRRERPDLSGVARVLMWLLLAGLVGWAVIAVLRNLVRDRKRDEPEPPPLDDTSDSPLAAALEARRAIETDVQRLLARAEAAAARSQHEAAIADVHAALLRRLEGERLITVDRWKTNGDYVQALRDKPGLRDEVRSVVREVEQVQFGSAVADAGRYASVRDKVVAIVGRAALALALVVGLSCDQGIGAKPVPPLGTGPSGQRAIAELLLANDIDVQLRINDLDQLSSASGALVLLDDVSLTDDDWDRLLAWVEAGGTLVVATGREFPRRLGVDYVPAASDETALVQHGSSCCAAPASRTITTPHAHDIVLARPPHHAYVLRRELGEGTLVVFAEPDLLRNAALLVERNAAALLALFQSLDVDRVEFLRIYSSRDAPDTPFESVRNAKLGALFLQVLLFLALLYAAVGIPFARLRDPPEQQRRSFVEHVRTLGMRYAQARAAHHVAALYSGWALDRLRARLQPGGRRSLHALAETIAARTGRSTADVMQILADAHNLREHATTIDEAPAARTEARGSAGELALMRQLAALLDQTR